MISFKEEILFKLPLLISRALVGFPNSNKVMYIEREFSMTAMDISIANFESYMIFTAQKDPQIENIESIDQIYTTGVLCKVTNLGRIKNSFKARVEFLDRIRIENISFEENTIFGSALLYPDKLGDFKEEDAYIRQIITSLEEADERFIPIKSSKNFSDTLVKGINSLDLSYVISNSIEVNVQRKQELLEANDVNQRFLLLLESFEEIKTISEIENRIQNTIKENTDKNSKDYYLREKIRAIKKELGEDGADEGDRILEILENGSFPREVVKKGKEELKKYSMMPPSSPESGLILDYLNLLISLPWNIASIDNDDLKNAEKVLNKDHFGLEKVKKRIIEYLAVKQAKGNLKAPIICLYGPPGCGKTSICKSIAEALNREFVKTSFGGVSDESEIRGHRRTYVASRPGRIIQQIKKAGYNNPVFLLDEIDKIGKDGFKGDPTAALMEVLDPVQNVAFNDNYLEVPFDLSDVLFICTANYIGNIPAPLRDRLELIEVESYTLLEKTKIAKKYLIKKELEENGIYEPVNFSDEAIKYLIEHYTKEAGVRELQRQIGSIVRKIVVEKVKNGKLDKKDIKVNDIRKYLGVEIFESTSKEKGSQVGVVTGLAYTEFGGDILPIEVNYFKGNGQLVLTGKLGDVMKESCSIALDYVKSNAATYNIDPQLFKENDIHIHVPEGAVPKDGPSAGCAITVAIVSALTKIPVSGNVAMTGEVTLRGNSLAIGGLKEKSLAALRSGIKTIIVPKENKKTVSELPKEVLKNLEILFMEHVSEAIKICLGI